MATSSTFESSVKKGNNLQSTPDSSHRVVVMPSSEFRGTGASQNTDYQYSTPYRRSRSRSIGRKSGSRSHDIVQDVYNRMGVNYTRGHSSIENLLEDNKGLVSKSSNQKNARQLSSENPFQAVPKPKSRGRSTTRRIEREPSTSTKAKSPTDRDSILQTLNHSRSFNGERNDGHSYFESRDDDHRQEAARNDEDAEARSVGARSVLSVKDRISAFETSSRKTSAQNIRSYNGLASDRRRDSSANSVSHRSTKSGVADAFLVAISQNKPAVSSPRSSKGVPIVEIQSRELHNGIGIESASLAASSVSGEDFASKNLSSTKLNFRAHNIPTLITTTENGYNEKVEKLIEERVQSQVSQIYKHFEAEICRIETRLADEYRSRIEKLEKKTDKLYSVFSKFSFDD